MSDSRAMKAAIAIMSYVAAQGPSVTLDRNEIAAIIEKHLTDECQRLLAWCATETTNTDLMAILKHKQEKQP